MGTQLSFFPEVDEKEIRSIVVSEIKLYKAMKIQQQNKKELSENGIEGYIFPKLKENDLVNELKVLQMERALNNLDYNERKIIEMKYLNSHDFIDINVYLELGIKKGKYYTKKKAAINNICYSSRNYMSVFFDIMLLKIYRRNMMRKNSFLEKFNVSIEEFEENKLNWDTLVEIFKDYNSHLLKLKSESEIVAGILRTNSEVHSVRSRVKDPEHLLHKIIRKTIRKRETDTSYEITKENYLTEVTDVIGIRVLHLYKEQARNIDKMIRDTWDLKETPTIYHREGDINDESLKKDDSFDLKIHPSGYRSWHYLISTQATKIERIIEVQVRTIFEEGWSEIDHLLRYPLQLDNELLNKQLLVLNRLAGNADEMVNTITDTLSTFQIMSEEKEQKEQVILDLNNQLEELKKSKDLKEQDIQPFKDSIKKLENNKWIFNLSEENKKVIRETFSNWEVMNKKLELHYPIKK